MNHIAAAPVSPHTWLESSPTQALAIEPMLWLRQNRPFPFIREAVDAFEKLPFTEDRFLDPYFALRGTLTRASYTKWLTAQRQTPTFYISNCSSDNSMSQKSGGNVADFFGSRRSRFFFIVVLALFEIGITVTKGSSIAPFLHALF